MAAEEDKMNKHERIALIVFAALVLIGVTIMGMLVVTSFGAQQEFLNQAWS